ncbi:MAG: methyl-accepting chemotaxis protein [Firmicutes bacterium]|nr:methyl-accepting chemotaxis protein [Bacillota bacterium]
MTKEKEKKAKKLKLPKPKKKVSENENKEHQFKFKKFKQKDKKAGNEWMNGISIRAQLYFGFLLPVVFIVIVGLVSYKYASIGLVENYEESAKSAVEMTVSCLDQGFASAQMIVMELSNDTTVTGYSLGGYDNNTSQKNQAKTNLKNTILVKQGLNDVVQEIHILPMADESFLTTKTISGTSEMDSFIEDMVAAGEDQYFSNNYPHWGSEHAYMDSQIGTSTDDYILYCSRKFNSGSRYGAVFVDIKSEYVIGLLDELDFGEESQMTFTTADGRSIGKNNVIDVRTLDIFTKAGESEDSFVSGYTKCEGVNYFYMISKSSQTGATLTVLVPKSYITQKSDSIRLITILMVVFATFIAIVISTVIVRIMAVNIKKSISSLDEVAQGNLVLKEGKIAHNEFGRLRKAIMETAGKIRGLVFSVKGMMEKVSFSADKVSHSSVEMDNMVSEMSEDIQEIGRNIEKENNAVNACHNQMEELSKKIKKAGGGISETMEGIEATKHSIDKGMEAMEAMTGQSERTTAVTEEVRNEVIKLGGRLEEIIDFVDSIANIADQTNLLSLNASIEAARAGEFGRGFSVVAEEIRKLADSSSKTAQDIQKEIGEVTASAESAVNKVKEAQDIVNLQNKQVKDTVAVFEQMNEFMKKFIVNMEMISADMENMNNDRKIALSSIREINDISQNNIDFITNISASIEQQMAFANQLSEEAIVLQRNMEELESAVTTFKVE